MDYPVVDADRIVHELYFPGTETYRQILMAFGPEFQKPDGSLDRLKLGQRVFSNPKDLQTLESILHPAVRKKVEQLKNEFTKQGRTVAFYDVPLLFEKNLEKDFDAIVVVTCSEETQMKRLMQRSHLSREDALKRLSAQVPLEKKIQGADFVIENQGSLRELEEEVLKCVSQINKIS
ncbi:MAG: dephospho-CoA kinase [Oligoflexia bacterium]|nr:MAG: dephospho-CoA kinase [Oligoflexia bacterium]